MLGQQQQLGVEEPRVVLDTAEQRTHHLGTSRLETTLGVGEPGAVRPPDDRVVGPGDELPLRSPDRPRARRQPRPDGEIRMPVHERGHQRQQRVQSRRQVDVHVDHDVRRRRTPRFPQGVATSLSVQPHRPGRARTHRRAHARGRTCRRCSRCPRSVIGPGTGTPGRGTRRAPAHNRAALEPRCRRAPRCPPSQEEMLPHRYAVSIPIPPRRASSSSPTNATRRESRTTSTRPRPVTPGYVKPPSVQPEKIVRTPGACRRTEWIVEPLRISALARGWPVRRGRIKLCRPNATHRQLSCFSQLIHCSLSCDYNRLWSTRPASRCGAVMRAIHPSVY